MNKLRKFYKGFTLIELLVVIAILGILTLLAMPRFKDHIENARVTNIKNDVKVAESIVMESLINDKNIPSISDDEINHEKLATLAKENKLYDIKGRVSEGNIESGEYIELDKSIFNTKLKGFFYANQGGKVYYEDIKSGNPSKPIDKSDLIDKKEEAENLNPDDYEDFTDIEDALEEADRVIKDEDATQDEVDNALKDLEDAIDNLEEKPIDKSDLIDKKEEAENLNPDDYEDFAEVEDAINEAERIINDENATQKEVDNALKDLEDALGGLKDKLVDGFYGEVSANDLITGDALAQKLKITEGVSQFSNEPWLKFNSNGRIIYVAKKPIRHSISWEAIYNAGAVYGDDGAGGDAKVNIDGQTYKIRLMQGANTSTPRIGLIANKGVINHNSEWNRLMLPIHEKAKDKSWEDPANVEINTLDWTQGANGGKGYNDDDFSSRNPSNYEGRSSGSWTQESIENMSSPLYRGYIYHTYSDESNDKYKSWRIGWRPVLELVE